MKKRMYAWRIFSLGYLIVDSIHCAKFLLAPVELKKYMKIVALIGRRVFES